MFDGDGLAVVVGVNQLLDPPSAQPLFYSAKLPLES